MDDEVQILEEIDWDPQPVLRPGVDYQSGVVYFTIPLTRRVLVPSKKKDMPGKVESQLQTYVVTSDREGIWYDKEALEAHGFQRKEFIMQELETRWSRESVKAFLDRKSKAPSSRDVFRILRGVYTSYVEFADEIYHDIMALYVMYTYVFRLFESTGYVHFNGTAASGKSRNLSILNALAFNTIWASSLSAAALYRKLDGSPGTTCIDESEGWEGERGEELRRILNAGYKQGAQVGRAEKGTNDRWTTAMYEVYGPKALASINPLEDVIASRCLVVAMRPAIRELPDFLTSDPALSQIRDGMYLWAMDNTKAIAELDALWRDPGVAGKKARLCPRLIGRQWETTAQYIILADYIGGEEFASRIITFMNAYFAKQQEAMNATDRIRTTLRCLPRVLATKAAHPGHLYSIKDIHEVVSSYMEEDSTEYFKTKHVMKNLDTLGFKKKVRAAGGIRIELSEDAVRNEFTQRRVDPFDEDVDWLAGKRSYIIASSIFDTGLHSPVEIEGRDNDVPWWEQEEPE